MLRRTHASALALGAALTLAASGAQAASPHRTHKKDGRDARIEALEAQVQELVGEVRALKADQDAARLAPPSPAPRAPGTGAVVVGEANSPASSPDLPKPSASPAPVFVGASIDRRFHAMDIDTGKELWTAELPASAHAMPMTYEAGGTQYVVIAAGGSAKLGQEKQGDALVAFALPKDR